MSFYIEFTLEDNQKTRRLANHLQQAGLTFEVAIGLTQYKNLFFTVESHLFTVDGNTFQLHIHPDEQDRRNQITSQENLLKLQVIVKNSSSETNKSSEIFSAKTLSVKFTESPKEKIGAHTAKDITRYLLGNDGESRDDTPEYRFDEDQKNFLQVKFDHEMIFPFKFLDILFNTKDLKFLLIIENAREKKELDLTELFITSALPDTIANARTYKYILISLPLDRKHIKSFLKDDQIKNIVLQTPEQECYRLKLDDSQQKPNESRGTCNINLMVSAIEKISNNLKANDSHSGTSMGSESRFEMVDLNEENLSLPDFFSRRKLSALVGQPSQTPTVTSSEDDDAFQLNNSKCGCSIF